jgi:hypothetical protein
MSKATDGSVRPVRAGSKSKVADGASAYTCKISTRLTPPYFAELGGEIYFQAFGAGTAEGAVVGKDDMAAVFADHAAVG